jgi:hypothetical protein
VPRFYQKARFSRETIKVYTDDSFYVSNFILCNVVGEQGALEIYSIELPPDSIKSILDTAFMTNDFHLKWDGGTNYCNQKLVDSRPLRGGDLDRDEISSLITQDINGYQMVPVVYIDNHLIFSTSFSSGGIYSANGWMYLPFITIAVFIFDGDKLIYRRMFTHKADGANAPGFEQALRLPPASGATQDDWNELVRRLMKDYTKRKV